MNSLSKNRYLDAFLKALLFIAIIHFFIMLLYSIINLQPGIFNIFRIVELDLFFPNIIEGSLSSIISIILYLMVFPIAFFFFTRKSPQITQ